MCLFSSDPPEPPPPAPPAAPAPVATVEPSEGNNRKDSQYMSASKGRSSLRIDRTMNAGTDSTGSGLNIPTS